MCKGIYACHYVMSISSMVTMINSLTQQCLELGKETQCRMFSYVNENTW